MDALSVAGGQVLSLAVLAIAGILFGNAFAGATMEYGLKLPGILASAGTFALGAFGLWTSFEIADRSRDVWGDPRGRTLIVAGLVQMLLTALPVGVAGAAMAGWRIDLMTTGQSILSWACYGLVLACAAQALLAVGAFALLMSGRKLPQLGD